MNNNTKGLYHTEEVQMMDLIASLTLESHGLGVEMQDDPKEVTFQSAVKRTALSSSLFSQYINRLMVAHNTRQEKCITAKTHAERNEAVMDFANECEHIITGLDILLNSAEADLKQERRA